MAITEFFRLQEKIFRRDWKKRRKSFVPVGVADAAAECSRGFGLQAASFFRGENWLQRHSGVDIRGDHDAGVDI